MSRTELKVWLKYKPIEFAQVIAVRAALRVLPYVFVGRTPEDWVARYSLVLFRTAAIAWASCNDRSLAITESIKTAIYHDILAAKAATHGAANSTESALLTLVGAANAFITSNDTFQVAANAAAESAGAPIYAVKLSSTGRVEHFSNGTDKSLVWGNMVDDCSWLESQRMWNDASYALSNKRLWRAGEPDSSREAWKVAAELLSALNGTNSVWIDWYNRRIEGHDAAFDIPGDTDRTEDKAILARLADATDEDFWGKGATYVNATLQSWIDEACARVAARVTPHQEIDALTYGINTDGILDRLSPADQQHLRDAPDQQRIYRDVREAALELQQEGQRLGARLEKAIGRFVSSLPEDFAAAECYSVWRDGNTLRRIHLAHRAVAGGKDPDDRRLDPAMAEILGDVLDRYNLFAFGDDGLRAKDGAAIPPQERAKAEEEAEKAAPLVAAMLDAPEIMTEIVRDDIVADQADRALPKGDAYDDQVLVQSNKSMRNRIAGILTGVAQQIKQSAKSVREGAERAIGAFVVSDAAGVTNVHGPIVTFTITHLAKLKAFAETAYANVSLQWLWDALAKLAGLL